ncbi:pseudaminic acid synthase [Helicobacter aurati]|uniref:Pseudaminic acid synthase n=1 Tax=Helicobacter aurati TaxID=137778 RepID=A0A3D8J130_9HELI|nr:pseudaminic acid synthase [Helicobacter aurati]RDU71249.1 pseudaminic acid synthase [Helicobacter aurati]
MLHKTHSPFIVAELSANHNQKIELALQSVEAVAKSGAHAIKVQTYKPSCLTLQCYNDFFRIKEGLWRDKYLWELYQEAQMPWEWHAEIFDLAKSLGLVAFSSPFSVEGVEFLEKLDCPIYKIASFEIMHIPLLRAVAQTKKPVVLSLGIANDKEIESALEILSENASRTILYCISAYPADMRDIELFQMQVLQEKWKDYHVEIGISDHTLGVVVPIVATICGAKMIEKHFILDRNLGGVDSCFSLNQEEFRELVRGVHDAHTLGMNLPFYSKGMGILSQDSRFALLDKKTAKTHEKSLSGENKKGREFARSLFVSRDVKRGEKLSLENIACVRPSNGLSPLLLDSLLGKVFNQDIACGTPLQDAHILL